MWFHFLFLSGDPKKKQRIILSNIFGGMEKEAELKQGGFFLSNLSYPGQPQVKPHQHELSISTCAHMLGPTAMLCSQENPETPDNKNITSKTPNESERFQNIYEEVDLKDVYFSDTFFIWRHCRASQIIPIHWLLYQKKLPR